MRTYFTMLLLAAIVSFLVTPFAQRLAFLIGAVDRPDPRKIHRAPTARLGGLAVFLGFAAPWAALYLLDNRSQLSPTERVGQMCSWGLMQVMGAVAREYGFKGYFPQLCDPVVGLRYGCLHVTKFRAKYGQWSDVIAAYNAGSPRREPTNPWSYVNQFYVNKVLTVWNGLEVPIPLTETEI